MLLPLLKTAWYRQGCERRKWTVPSLGEQFGAEMPVWCPSLKRNWTNCLLSIIFLIEKGATATGFRKARVGDFPSVRNLYTEAIDEPDRAINYPKWVNGLHPSEPLLTGAIEKGWLLLLTDRGDVIDSVILNCFLIGECPTTT